MKSAAWTVFLLALLAAPALGQSDGPTLNWGPATRAPGNSSLERVVGLTPNDIYFLRTKNSGAFSSRDKIYVERYTRDLKLQHSEEIVLRLEKKDVQLENVLFLDDQLYLLTSYANKAHQKVYLFLQKLSNRNMRPTGSPRKVLEGPLTRVTTQGSAFDFQLAPDSSKVLVYYQIPSAAKDPERFSIHVLDNKLETLWSREVILPYPSGSFAVREYRVDESGKVFLLGAVYEAGQRNRRLPTHYRALEYREGDLAPAEWKISLPDRFITDLTFRIAKNGDLICSGFYSDRDAVGAKGICYFRLDAATRQMTTQTWQPFDFDFRAGELSERGRRRAMEAEMAGNERGSAELARFNLDELVLRTDGGALLVAEQFYVQERILRNYWNYWGRAMEISYFYFYNDIIVVNIQPSGAIEWAVKIPKQQISIDDGGYYSSYVMATVRDRLYFLYNDSNWSVRSPLIRATEVRKDGSTTTFPLNDQEAGAMLSRPKASRQIGSRLIALVGERGRNVRLGAVNFPAN
jgi:hypothetical protein